MSKKSKDQNISFNWQGSGMPLVASFPWSKFCNVQTWLFAKFVESRNGEPGLRPELHVFGHHILNWKFFRFDWGSQAVHVNNLPTGSPQRLRLIRAIGQALHILNSKLFRCGSATFREHQQVPKIGAVCPRERACTAS